MRAGAIMTLEFYFNALTYVWVAGEVLIAVFTRTRRGEGKVQDRGSQVILWIVIVASISVEKLTHEFFPSDMPGSSSWLRPAAFAILLFGLGIRAAAIFTLGNAFSANVALRAFMSKRRRCAWRLEPTSKIISAARSG
jgi:hypothetical protein